MKKWAFIAVMVAVVLMGSWSTGFCKKIGPQHEATKQLISLVNDAAALVEEKGEETFTEFLKPGSIWSHGETYIIVFDMDGNCLVHTDLEQIGKNHMNLMDVNGKPIFRSILGKVSGFKVAGWTHYLWPKPESVFPSWKSVYAKRAKTPGGKEYIVACGLYNMKMERMFIVEVVNEAIELIEKTGKRAFQEFRSKSGDFYFFDTYVFVVDDQGYDLVNAAFPNLEGRNVYDLRDEKGKYLIREFINTVKTNGSGWVDYFWARPGQTESVKKTAYVKGMTLNGTLLVVGSGFYLEN